MSALMASTLSASAKRTLKLGAEAKRARACQRSAVAQCPYHHPAV